MRKKRQIKKTLGQGERKIERTLGQGGQTWRRHWVREQRQRKRTQQQETAT